MLSTGILRRSVWITCPSNWTMIWPVCANTSNYLYLVLIRADEPVAGHLHTPRSCGSPRDGAPRPPPCAHLDVVHHFPRPATPPHALRPLTAGGPDQRAPHHHA